MSPPRARAQRQMKILYLALITAIIIYAKSYDTHATRGNRAPCDAAITKALRGRPSREIASICTSRSISAGGFSYERMRRSGIEEATPAVPISSTLQSHQAIMIWQLCCAFIGFFKE